MEQFDDLNTYIIPIVFNKLNKDFNKQYDVCLKPYGLSKFHAFYLLCLYYNREGLKLNELNKLIGCDKANTSRAIGDLEEKGIIFKNNIDCSEKKYLVKLTTDGERIAKEFIHFSNNAIKGSLLQLTEDERTSLHNIIMKLFKKEDKDDTD